MFNQHQLFRICLLLVLCSFATLSLLARTQPYFGIDLTITRTVQSISLPGFTNLMVLVTNSGYYFWGSVITITAAITVARLTRRTLDGWFVILATSGSFIISTLIKFIVNRPRPDIELVHLIGNEPTDPSFPSGHVMLFISLYGFLAYLAYTKIKTIWQRNLAIGTFVLPIMLVAVSRIYLGVHWFSDVVGAALIGLVWLYLLTYWYRKTLD